MRIVLVLLLILQPNHFLWPHVFLDILNKDFTHIGQKFFMPWTVLIWIVWFRFAFLLWLDGPDRTLVAQILNGFLGLVLCARVIDVVEWSEALLRYWDLGFDSTCSELGFLKFLFWSCDGNWEFLMFLFWRYNGKLEFVIFLVLFLGFDKSLQDNLLDA